MKTTKKPKTTKVTSKKIAKAIKEMEREIAWYGPPKEVASLMMKLAKLGFYPSGHGCGFGDEDWSLHLSKPEISCWLYRANKTCHIFLEDTDPRYVPRTKLVSFIKSIIKQSEQ